MEEWVLIEDFPDYGISSLGRVRNEFTRRVLSLHNNGGDVMQVVIRRDKKNHARAVAKLVALAFLDPPPDDDYVAMQIDGDYQNNRAENLVWKERWYAQARTKQRKRTRPVDPRPVLEVRTGVVFENALEAAKELDGLENLVILTAQNKHGATYLRSAWRFVEY